MLTSFPPLLSVCVCVCVCVLTLPSRSGDNVAINSQGAAVAINSQSAAVVKMVRMLLWL